MGGCRGRWLLTLFVWRSGIAFFRTFSRFACRDTSCASQINQIDASLDRSDLCLCKGHPTPLEKKKKKNIPQIVCPAIPNRDEVTLPSQLEVVDGSVAWSVYRFGASTLMLDPTKCLLLLKILNMFKGLINKR